MGMFWGLSGGVHVPSVSILPCQVVRSAETAMTASTWLGMCLRVSQGAVMLSSIGVDDAGLYFVLIKQLLQCVLIK